MRAPAFPPRANHVALLAGVAAGPLAAAELPLEMPSYHDDKGNELGPSLSLEGAFFPQSQSWFGKSKYNLGETSNYSFEKVRQGALRGQAALDGYGTMYGKVSGIFTATQRTDAAGSDVPDDTPSDLAWEDAYVGWRSANLFASSLGTDAIDLSYGRQRYQVVAEGPTLDLLQPRCGGCPVGIAARPMHGREGR